jgi:hypothetical protein
MRSSTPARFGCVAAPPAPATELNARLTRDRQLRKCVVPRLIVADNRQAANQHMRAHVHSLNGTDPAGESSIPGRKPQPQSASLEPHGVLTTKIFMTSMRTVKRRQASLRRRR